MIHASRRTSPSRKRLSSRLPAKARMFEALEHRLMYVVFPVSGTAGNDVITLSLTGGSVVATVNGTPSAMPDTLATSVTINAQGGNDTILIHSNGTNPVTVNAGAGVDSVEIAPTTENLDNIGANVTINGDGDGDTVSLFDANRATGLAYVFNAPNQMQRATGAIYTFNTVELAALDGASGNDFYSFNAMPALPWSLTDNGGGGTIQINGNGTENIAYRPDAAASGKGVLNLGAQDVGFTGMNGIFCADLNNIQVITPNPQDAITITQPTALVNRLTGTSGGVAVAPIHWNTIANALQLELGANDNGATTNAVTLTGDLIGSPRIDLNGSLTTDGGTSTATVNDGTWALNLNISPNRIAWRAFLSGAGTDVTFAADEKFIRLEVGGGATARLSGIGNDTTELAVPAGQGTINVASGGLLESSHAFGIAAGATLLKQGTGTLTTGPVATPQHGVGATLDVRQGTFNGLGDLGTPTTRNLSVSSRTAVNFSATQHLAGVFADIGGRIRMQPNGSRALVVTDAAVNGEGGQIDLTDNDMIVDYTGPSQLDNVLSLIRGGFAGGSWGGIGIASSTAAADPKRSLGYAEATDLFAAFPATFAGQQVDSTAVLIKHTFAGDHNLDGAVNLIDFNSLAAHFGAAGRHWLDGDNDYNQTVNLADFNRLAATFGSNGLASGGSGTGVTRTFRSIVTEVLDEPDQLA